jgi:Na+-translocating ferredoxin:NAD+ oxidoreductase subunit B
MQTKAVASLIQAIDAALPQTQCTRCGYPDCHSYAVAVAQGQAQINQCPPGGQQGIERLSAITGHAVLPLSAEHGTESPMAVALIDENWCIGCTLCIKACPTDAIVGSNKRMHTVLPQYCTGCDLCLPVCPVDCISMHSVSGEHTGWAAWSPEQAQLARQRYDARQARLLREQAAIQERNLAKAEDKLAHLAEHTKHTEPEVLDRKRALIEAALAKARQRQAQR